MAIVMRPRPKFGPEALTFLTLPFTTEPEMLVSFFLAFYVSAVETTSIQTPGHHVIEE